MQETFRKFQQKLTLKVENHSSPAMSIGTRELLLQQIEEKRQLEQHEKLKDQEFFNLIQKRDQTAAEREEKQKLREQQRKDSYLRDLRDQMKEQQKLKTRDYEMDDREKQLNRLKLKQLVKNNPERYKRKAKKLEDFKSRNKNTLSRPTPQTFEPELPKESKPLENMKTLDFSKEVKMPEIKKPEVQTVEEVYGKDLNSERVANRTPGIPPRNYHYAKGNMDLHKKLIHKNTREKNDNEGSQRIINYSNIYTNVDTAVAERGSVNKSSSLEPIEAQNSQPSLPSIKKYSISRDKYREANNLTPSLTSLAHDKVSEYPKYTYSYLLNICLKVIEEAIS